VPSPCIIAHDQKLEQNEQLVAHARTPPFQGMSWVNVDKLDLLEFNV